MSKRKPKPPPKFTPEVAEKIITAVGLDAPAELVALYAGVKRNTIWRWVKRGEGETKGPLARFAREYRAAQAEAVVGNLRTIRAASRTHWQAAAWLLERLHPTTFGRPTMRLPDGTVISGVESPVLIQNQQTVNVQQNLQVQLRESLQDPKILEAFTTLEAALHGPKANAAALKPPTSPGPGGNGHSNGNGHAQAEAEDHGAELG